MIFSGDSAKILHHKSNLNTVVLFIVTGFLLQVSMPFRERMTM